MSTNYTIQSGDNLWNICKKHFKLNNNTDIAKKVKEVAKTNNISNPNLIFAGHELKLEAAMDVVEKSTQTVQAENVNNAQGSTPVTKKEGAEMGENYHNWAFNKDSYEKTWDYIAHDSKGDAPVKDFDFLGIDMTKVPAEKKAQTYTDGVLKFAQSSILNTNTDNDSTTLTFDEFFAEEKQDAQTLGIENLKEENVRKAFDNMDLDGNGKIDVKERAAVIAYLDMDDQNGGKIDGKITHKSAVVTNFENTKIAEKLKEMYAFLFNQPKTE